MLLERLAKLTDRAERSMSLSIAVQPGRTLPERRRRNAFEVVDRSLEARRVRPLLVDRRVLARRQPLPERRQPPAQAHLPLVHHRLLDA